MAMTESQVTTLARTLMAEHGLVHPAWTFRLGRPKTRLGFCQWWNGSRGRDAIGQIVFSKHFLHLDDYQIKDTILHEIAHAIAGHKADHGPEWRMVCRQIGALPNECADLKSEERVEHKWTGICPNDYTHTAKRNQLTKRGRYSACSTCCRKFNGGVFTEKFLFDWHLTEDLRTSGKSGIRLLKQPEQPSQIPTRISEAMAAMRVAGE